MKDGEQVTAESVIISKASGARSSPPRTECIASREHASLVHAHVGISTGHTVAVVHGAASRDSVLPTSIVVFVPRSLLRSAGSQYRRKM